MNLIVLQSISMRDYFLYLVKCSNVCLRNFNQPNHKPYYDLLSFCLILVFHLYSYFLIYICRCGRMYVCVREQVCGF